MIDPHHEALVKRLPKVELHRHFEGSVRLETLVDIARTHAVDAPSGDAETLRPYVQITPETPRSSQAFLSKFRVLRRFYCSLDVIARMTREVVEDAALDQVRYMELRFTPQALSSQVGCSYDEVVRLVCEESRAAALQHGIQVRLIVSMNRHEAVELGEAALESALAYRHLGIVGLDLAGDEENYSAMPFQQIFLRAKDAGLGLTVHAGEWAGSASVWDAVGSLRADRIGHGIKVLEDPSMVQMLVDRQIALEVCPSSNLYSGIVESLADHPLKTLTEHKILTTLNTDDPAVCDVSLSDEFNRMLQHQQLSLEDIQQYTLRAARAAFLEAEERESLIADLHSLWTELS